MLHDLGRAGHRLEQSRVRIRGGSTKKRVTSGRCQPDQKDPAFVAGSEPARRDGGPGIGLANVVNRNDCGVRTTSGDELDTRHPPYAADRQWRLRTLVSSTIAQLAPRSNPRTRRRRLHMKALEMLRLDSDSVHAKRSLLREQHTEHEIDDRRLAHPVGPMIPVIFFARQVEAEVFGVAASMPGWRTLLGPAAGTRRAAGLRWSAPIPARVSPSLRRAARRFGRGRPRAGPLRAEHGRGVGSVSWRRADELRIRGSHG
jgi:hypothetical protein